ncbi:MAG: hypothetical protein U9Q22_02650 [Candidatus Altiarchaeota archaeon]|nr:hypothetical protein [Candidatus Altiarchaeota archaeon]
MQKIIWVIPLLLIAGNVNAGLYYTGDVVLKEETVTIKVSYENQKAILDANARYLLKNTGERVTIKYEYYAFGQSLKGGEVTLDADEEKLISLETSKTLGGSPYSLSIDFNLLLDGKYSGNKAGEGEFIVSFPSKPTITGTNIKPTTTSDLGVKWMKTDYVPVTDIRLSWINKEIKITLKKELIPRKIKRGDAITIRAIIKNDDDVSYDCNMADRYMADSFTPIDESEFEKRVPKVPIEPTFWIFKRKFTLNAREEKVFEYRLKFLESRGITEMNLLGFSFSIPDENFFKESDRAFMEIIVCNNNGICERERYENYPNCPGDCPSGSSDGYCDMIEDGVCDPDCAEEFDVDCIPLMCGDGACDFGRGENYKNCPQDCPSGSSDGYCDMIEDGICDPDCSREEDTDCVGVVEIICGDGICNTLGGEDYMNCPQDCPAPVICGDGICGVDENYKNCKLDCPSGSSDGYCDRIDDGVCDLDCTPEEDPDCKKTLSEFKYIILLLAIIVIIFLIYVRMRRG